MASYFVQHVKSKLMASGSWWLAVLAVCLLPTTASAATPPELPRVLIDTSEIAPTGRTIAVAGGGDFQAALDSAQPGDVITLQAGAVFTGPFSLPAKSGSGWIIVRTSTPDSGLPPFGRRITPAHASLLPKVVARSSEPALYTEPGAHHFRFIGIEFTFAPGVTFAYDMVRLGDGGQTSAQVPHNLIFDRVYAHGTATAELRRCIALNSASTAIINSYLADCHQTGVDSQAIGGWNGPGPFKIANNFLEGAGENLMFGGGDPSIANLVPSDIEIRGNHFYKPVSWKIGHPQYAGTPWGIKNLFELKNARRVLVVGNVFEHNWPHAQNGFAILFTVRNQDGTAPWSVVSDVTFTHNIVRHVAGAINMHNTDDNQPSQPTARILIQHNLFEDVGSPAWGGLGILIQVGDGPSDVVVNHNTAFQTSHITAAGGRPAPNFVFTNNIAPHNEYGVGGDGTYGNPMQTLATYFPGAIFANNAIVGGPASSYPLSNFFPSSFTNVGFVNLSAGDYRLNAGSALRNAATDGTDVGADINALDAHTTGVASGRLAQPPAAPTNVRIVR